MTERPKKLQPQPGGPHTPLGRALERLKEELAASGRQVTDMEPRRGPGQMTVTVIPRRAADAQVSQGPAPAKTPSRTGD